jgi:quercetin dioxygenase-like cupin family protein
VLRPAGVRCGSAIKIEPMSTLKIRLVSRTLVLVAGYAILQSVPLQRSAGSTPGIAAASAAEVVTIDRAVRDYKLPEQIPWGKKSASGTQSATLVGDPSKPGLYIQLLRRPPNNWSQPHKHDHDRYITVLEGTMWIGTGNDFDVNKTVPLRAGSFLTDFGGQTHFDGSKEDGLTIEIMGIVPANHVAAGAR